MKEKKIKVDVDSAIRHYNEMNPDSPINKVILADKLGINVQNLSNYNAGKTAKILGTVVNISLFTGYPIHCLIVEDEQ